MIHHLDEDFVNSIIAKFGYNLQDINLSNNGKLIIAFELKSSSRALLSGLRSLSRIDKFSMHALSMNLSSNELSILLPLQTLVELKELNLSDNLMYKSLKFYNYLLLVIGLFL